MAFIRPSNFLGGRGSGADPGYRPVHRSGRQGEDGSDLSFTTIGVFPKPARAPVIWVGLGGELDRFTSLRGRVDDVMAGLGVFQRWRGPFWPHLGPGRCRCDLVTLRDMDVEVSDTDFEVAGLVLNRNEPGPKGAKFTPLRTISLGRTPRP